MRAGAGDRVRLVLEGKCVAKLGDGKCVIKLGDGRIIVEDEDNLEVLGKFWREVKA